MQKEGFTNDPKIKNFLDYEDGKRYRMWILTVNQKKGDDVIPVTRYFGFLNTEEECCREIIIWHMEKQYISKSLNHLADRFVACINSKKVSLISEVAEFRFKFAMIAPIERGSCALGEWFENSIIHSHTKKFVIYTLKKLVELEIFGTAYLPDFIKVYPTLISCPGLDLTIQKSEEKE